MNTIALFLLRIWIFFMWNIQQLLRYLMGRRKTFIPITDLRIVYLHDGLVVVDKSHDLLINSRRPWLDCVTLQMQLFYALPHLANFELEHLFRFVHRLDAPTSGLICIAYSSKMAGLVSKAFQYRTTKKLYLAVVWGHVQDSTCLDSTRLPTSKYLSPLNIEPSRCAEICRKTGDMEYSVDLAMGDLLLLWPEGWWQKIMVPDYVPECSRPRAAMTKVTVLKHGFLEGLPASMLLLEPHSGRRHQLRLHCALGLRGHPIVGDQLYGRLFYDESKSEKAIRNYRSPRLMLHAYSLQINLVPKPPCVKGKKKQERVNHSHPPPTELYLESTRDLLRDCRWVDDTIFHQL